MFIASLFIFIGIAFFLRNSGLMPSFGWNVIWPLILIWIGIYLAMLAHKASDGWKKIIKIFKGTNKIDE